MKYHLKWNRDEQKWMVLGEDNVQRGPSLNMKSSAETLAEQFEIEDAK